MSVNFNFSAMVSTLIGCEHKVAVDDHAHRKARSDRDGRLNVQIATHHLLAGLVEAVGTASYAQKLVTG